MAMINVDDKLRKRIRILAAQRGEFMYETTNMLLRMALDFLEQAADVPEEEQSPHQYQPRALKNSDLFR